MAKYITSAQLQEIMDAEERGLDKYNEVLRRIAGIEAREYTTYQYFDERGEYVGDDNEMLLEDILDNAGVEVLPPEERTLDFPAKYTEIRALYHFCVDLGIKCTIEHLYDGYAVRFPDGSDFAQHYGTYGGTEGCVEPAIGDSEFDYTAVGLNLAKELVKKHKGKLEADHA